MAELLHIDTQIETNDELGVLGCAHFFKLPDGFLQMSITTPTPNSPAVVAIRPEAVRALVRNLIAHFMVPDGE